MSKFHEQHLGQDDKSLVLFLCEYDRMVQNFKRGGQGGQA